MTTLPQTTSIRLPRAPGAGPLAVPGTLLPGAPATPHPAMTGADVWRVIRSNLWLIILFLVLSAGAGYGLNVWLLKYYPKYTATAYVQVDPKVDIDPLKPDQTWVDMQSVGLEQRTQAQKLKNGALLSEVLKSPDSDVRQTAYFKQYGTPEEVKKNLMEDLVVTPLTDTKLIRVELSYRVPADTKTIIESVVNQHISDEEASSRDKQYDRSMALTNMHYSYQQKIQDTQAEIRTLSVDLSTSGFDTAGRMSAKDLELTEALREQMENQQLLTRAQQKKAAVTQQLQSGEDPAEVQELIDHDPAVQQLRANLNQVEIGLIEAQDAGPSSAQAEILKHRKEAYQKELQTAESNARTKARSEVLEQIDSQLAGSQKVLDDVNKHVEQIQTAIGEMSDKYARYLNDKDEEAGYQSMDKQIQEELREIENVKARKDLASISWAARPETPELPSFPRLWMTLTAAISTGLALSLGIAFLRELMDTSVRSPRDISRVGQMNLLGMVPHENDDPQAAGSRLPLVIFEAPHSIIAEQLRQVRTRLQHAASLDTTRSILITSPSPGDGKSTIACNLAAGLALNGRRILLVDANFRRPELHRVFNLSNENGFSDALTSLEQFDTTVQETSVPNLYVLPTGVKPANTTELLESQLLTDFIERALEEFDHVIFDSGPMLLVSETVALAPRVDGVVTVVRARHNSRGVLQRMRDSLRQIKAEHLGVVLNAVRALGGGYYGRNIRTYYAYQNERAA